MATQIIDRKWKTDKIALLLGHTDFTITNSNSALDSDDHYIIFVGIIDHTVNAYAEIMIDLHTDEVCIANH